MYIIYVNQTLGNAVTRSWLPASPRGETCLIPRQYNGVCGGQIDLGTCLSLSTLTSICPFHSTNAPYHCIAFLNFRNHLRTWILLQLLCRRKPGCLSQAMVGLITDFNKLDAASEKLIIHRSQDMAAIFVSCLYFGFPSLYTTLVCVACSQLEKLRAALLEIRQTHVKSEQNCEVAGDRRDGHVRAHASDEQFRRMQKQLNN